MNSIVRPQATGVLVRYCDRIGTMLHKPSKTDEVLYGQVGHALTNLMRICCTHVDIDQYRPVQPESSFCAPRSVRRQILTLQVNPGSRYRCGKSD